MPIRFRCEHCRTLLSIGTRKANSLTRCPTCQREVPVPGEPGKESPAVNEAIRPEPPPAVPPPVFQGEPAQLLKSDPPTPVPPPTPQLDEAPTFLGVAPLPASPTAGRGPRLTRRQYAAIAGIAGALSFVGFAVFAALADRQSDEDRTRTADARKDADRDEYPRPRQRPQPDEQPKKPPKVKPALDDGVLPPAPATRKPDKGIARPELIEKPTAKAEAPVLPSRPVVKADPPKQEKPAPPPAFAMKRRQKLGAEDLRKQLLDTPELALDGVPNTTATLVTLARTAKLRNQTYNGHVALVSRRSDIASLPMRMGKDCHLGKEPAEALQVLSRKLRVQLEASIPRAEGDVRPNVDKLRALLLGDQRNEWLKAEAVPAMMQLLQAENTPVRSLLVELLGQIRGKEASEALAVRAVSDLAPEVREQAVRELKKRPPDEFTHVLVDMLRYPWAPVADHAAEALATLEVKDALPQVIKMLDGPDPSLFIYATHGKQSYAVSREMVRINHLGNCVLCHAPSTDRNELVRGAVPTPGQPLPAPITTPQYYETGAIFVRADITYLKQDFSVMQPVENPNNWPAHQRFDYVVRQRTLTAPQIETLLQKQRQQTKLSPQREAMLFVLREVTGEDHGTKPENWLIVLPPDKRPKLSSTPENGKN